jgi:dTDP-4-amino-4,6-dideoxygalactose transaminase
MTRARIVQNDLVAGYHAYRAEIDSAWRRVMDGGRYILGPESAALEQEFARFLGAGHAIGTASGTDALQIALRVAGVAPGDLVLTVSFTAVATVAAVCLAGARPVFVDIEPTTYTMDPNHLEHVIADLRSGPLGRLGKARAVVPVHLYGQPADMTAIVDVARRNDLCVIEDCAQSHGASLAGKNAGTWGDLAAFSFYPTKNLGGYGDGGMVVAASSELADRCRSLRQYGWNDRRVSMELGQNSRLDELQAAMLRVKLRHLDDDNARRALVAAQYGRLLANPRVAPPQVRPGVGHVFHQYVVTCDARDSLRRYLSDHGIETLIHYPLPVHRHPAYAAYAPAAELPNTDLAARTVLSLPMYPSLAADAVTAVAETVNRWKGK